MVKNAFANLPVCSCNVIAERDRLWQAMVRRLFSHYVSEAHIQYSIGRISWVLGEGVVAGDGENAFENMPFYSCYVLQSVVGVGKPWFRAYLVIMYVMLTYSAR